MSALYLETSALVGWLMGEPAADEVRAAIDQATDVVTSTLAYCETERVLSRAEADGRIKARDVQRLRGMLLRARQGWTSLSVSEEILSRASRAFPVEPVRMLDAIHLATALEFSKAHADLRMSSLDRRILDNSLALGLV